MINASLHNYRQSPRKVRLLANLIRGKKVEQALLALAHTSHRAASPLRKLIESAVANAKNQNVSSPLIIKKITVDGGPIMYRRRPRARGAAAPIRKRTSHIEVVLAEIEEKKQSKAAHAAK